MKSFKSILFLGITLALFTACQSSTTEQETETATEQTSEIEAQQKLTLADFSIREGEIQEDGGVPLVKIFLTSPLAKEEILLVEENTYNPIETTDFGTMGIPKEAAFAFNTYYAGYGYHYYGKVKNNELAVYRMYIGEDATGEEAFELFKTIGLSEGVLVVKE